MYCYCTGSTSLISRPLPETFFQKGSVYERGGPTTLQTPDENLISDPAVCKQVVLQARLASDVEVGLACETSKQYGSIKLTEKMGFESLGSSHLQQQCGLVSKLFLLSVLGEDCGIVICVDVYHKVLISTVIIPLVAFMM